MKTKVEAPTKSSRQAVLRIPTNGSETQKSICQLPSIEHVQAAQINLQHPQLLHNFENHTYRTFVMDAQSWKEMVVPLALQVWIFDPWHPDPEADQVQQPFLIHAVFLVAASHLRHLQPHDSCHNSMVLLQSSQAPPRFCTSHDTPLRNEPDTGDTLMACSNFRGNSRHQLAKILILRIPDGWRCLDFLTAYQCKG